MPDPSIEALVVSILPRAARFEVAVLALCAFIRSCTARATDAGPLPDRIIDGTPRIMNRSLKASNGAA
ncbi:hypothetical protein KX928_17145 [Roseobacter sp. YSTF-M11]|uniref:Uncharacterized protein n=1 Tax=Roseobacter insulae TaxID=2859783 RepID=A0A9X1FY61_9RHOB|nr:hypothetical protein [Roseobacter insulae]MBW4709519.1 hypothetical protein [Roseobacter insulae]